MDDGRVADRNVVSNRARQFALQVQHRIVLNIGVMPDDNPVDIAAQNGVIPNAGKVAQSNISYDNCAPRDKDALPKARLLAQKSIKLLFKRMHTNKLIATAV